MAESISSSNSVSRQIYADIKSAFRAYANNKNKAEKTEKESETYADSGQFTRKAFLDIQKNIQITAKTEEEAETKAANTETTSDANQVNNTQAQTPTPTQTQTQTQTQTEKAEVKTFTLPKSTDNILSELRRNGLSRTKTAYQVAEEYGISYMKAREILDKLNADKNGFVREYNLPDNSTVSYRV